MKDKTKVKDRNKWCKFYFEKKFEPCSNPKNKYNYTPYELNLSIKKQGLSKIYKYRNGTEQDLDNLKNNLLSSVNYNFFNDPFEFQFSFDLEDVKDTYNILNGTNVTDCSNEVINFYDKLVDSTEKHLCDYTISCFSEDNDSLLMWSHYANEHKGFCIEYDIFDINKMNDLIFCPVIYSNDMPIFLHKDLNSQLNEMNKMIFNKSPSWSYEKEWRLTKFNSNEKVHMLKMPTPKAIYLGCRSSVELKNSLIKYCNSIKIPLFCANKNRTKYKLDFVKCK